MSEAHQPTASLIGALSPLSVPPVNKATPPAGNSRSQCSVCHKQFDRLDHLRRHLHSHENTRPFVCSDCPRKFNRRDLLNRHRTTAHGLDAMAQRKENKRLQRAIQACQACIVAKTKCDDKRPCQRCASRGMECGDRAPTRRSALLAEDDDNHLKPRIVSAPIYSQLEEQPLASDESIELMQISENTTAPTFSSIITLSNPALESPNTTSQAISLPTPEDPWYNFDVLPSAGLEDEFWTDFGSNADLFQIYQELGLQFDAMQPLEANATDIGGSGATQPVLENIQDGKSHHSTALNKPTMNPASLGFEAFKRSPWLWTPANQDHAYAEYSRLAVDSEEILESSQLSSSYRDQNLNLPEIKHSATRDEILAMVLKFSKSAIKVRSFPSLRLLNILVQAFFVRERASLDPWMHEPSFEPDRCPATLLAAMVATGSAFFAATNIWKMGLALQETVKLAICDALDEDNRNARQLQTGQTFLYWIELALWSGFRRKMEIGEGFAHTVPTMLRRAGAFHFSYYTSMCPPDFTDSGDVLRKKWLAWIEKESYKRLVFKILINEMRSSIAFVRSPVFSSVELTLPLPYSRDLWDARSPEEWKSRYLAKRISNLTITLSDAMHDAGRLELAAPIIDLGMSAHLTLYGLWGRVWSFLDTRSFQRRDGSQNQKPTSLLWSQAQHQELYSHIHKTKEQLASLRVLSPEADLMSEMLMMSLHVCTDDIQRFAGRFGEDEVRLALPLLQEWLGRDEHRNATWHAGQVLRAARRTPRTQLRGFLAIAVYYACLTLWVSSLISARRPSTSRQHTPHASDRTSVSMDHQTTSFQSSIPASMPPQDQVLIDGDENLAIRTYLATGHGNPCLSFSNQIRDLHDPMIFPKITRNIFRENFPDESEPLPPLLENLASLMDDLSKPLMG